MTEEQFYDYIAEAQKESEDIEDHAFMLSMNLVKMKQKEIVNFQKVFETQLQLLSTIKIWQLAQYVIGCNEEELEERFSYFCAWLIAQGKERLQKTLDNPDSLAEILVKDEDGEFICECESMLYVADNAYEMKTGKEDFYELFENAPFFEIEGDAPEEEPDWAVVFPQITSLRKR